jgi:hypothetical protein
MSQPCFPLLLLHGQSLQEAFCVAWLSSGSHPGVPGIRALYLLAHLGFLDSLSCELLEIGPWHYMCMSSEAPS